MSMEHKQQSSEAADSGDEFGLHTEIPPPRQRIFMQRSYLERALSFIWRVTWSVLCRWSPDHFNVWRIWVLRRFGVKIPYNTYISRSVRIEFPWNLKIGEHCRIDHGVIITCMGTVDIGNHCHISQYSHMCAGTHEYQKRNMHIIRSPISIGDYTWIAADVFIGPGVKVGHHVVVGARSSVFSDLEDNIIAVGEPAKKIKDNKWMESPVP